MQAQTPARKRRLVQLIGFVQKEYMGKRKHRRQESDLDSALQQEGYGGETLPFDDAKLDQPSR